jgi:hypothetical protein
MYHFVVYKIILLVVRAHFYYKMGSNEIVMSPVRPSPIFQPYCCEGSLEIYQCNTTFEPGAHGHLRPSPNPAKVPKSIDQESHADVEKIHVPQF